jgi:hypothetical protein
MKKRPDREATIVIFSSLGLVAALLSTLVPALLTAQGSPLFVGSSLGLFPGDIFGAVISVYFFAFAGVRSVTKAFGLVIASTVAYFVAFGLGISLGMFLSPAMGLKFNVESGELAGMAVPLLVGGMTGAFLVLVAVLRLYSAETSWRRVAIRAFQWSGAGSVLALIGWMLGSALGRPVWSALESLHLNVLPREMATRDGTPNFYSLHIVWQIGMGVILGILISEAPLEPVASGTQSVPARKLNLGNAFLFGIMALALGWYGIRWLPDEYREMRWHRAYAKHVAEKPSSDNLQQIALASADAMLVVTPIGEYWPERASGRTGPSVSGPAMLNYAVRYSLPGAPKGGPNVGPHVDVQVEEWPNADWATWELAEQNYSPTLNHAAEQSIKFGNRIVCRWGQASNSYKWGPSSSCAWSSGNRLVMIEFSSVDQDEFLRKYLERYPTFFLDFRPEHGLVPTTSSIGGAPSLLRLPE